MTVPGPEGPAERSEFAPPGAAYAVKLPIFEGPLDLLLHLIRLNEVDVVDIPIASIAEQYVEYLALMQELNLDVAGEYLLMAATLAWIKSRLILPPNEDAEEEEGGDPRAELIARLLEYQRFKEMAGELSERHRLGRDVFAARAPDLSGTPDAEREIEVGLVELLEAFRSVLKSVRAGSGTHEVESEAITVHERMVVVMAMLESRDSLEFEQVFQLESAPAPTRTMLVTTFLAILELARLAALSIYQGTNREQVPEGPIRLRRNQAEGDWSQRIAEVM